VSLSPRHRATDPYTPEAVKKLNPKATLVQSVLWATAENARGARFPGDWTFFSRIQTNQRAFAISFSGSKRFVP
jgi:hypothetical protein